METNTRRACHTTHSCTTKTAPHYSRSVPRPKAHRREQLERPMVADPRSYTPDHTNEEMEVLRRRAWRRIPLSATARLPRAPRCRGSACPQELATDLQDPTQHHGISSHTAITTGMITSGRGRAGYSGTRRPAALRRVARSHLPWQRCGFVMVCGGELTSRWRSALPSRGLHWMSNELLWYRRTHGSVV